MKYIILFLGIVAICFISFLNFFPDEARKIIYKVFNHYEFVVAVPNEYYIDSNSMYFKNYTDDVANKEELINYIYYVLNTGATYADGECKKEYKDCINDIKALMEDEKFTLSYMNNFVHPYNTFETVTLSYNNYGMFSVEFVHKYTKDDIAAIDFTVDKQIESLINENDNTKQKIKSIHDYIIDNTKYDMNKDEDIHDDTYKSDTAFGVLFEGYGICSGYTDAMAIFLTRLGIKNYEISNSKHTHVWNLVYVNGKWVHLDATWDDPVSEFNESRDTYFLIDYDELVSQDNDDTHVFDKEIFKEAY